MKLFKLVFILFLFPLSVKAVGLSVTPPSIDLIYPNIVEEKITVKNISSEPVIVGVYADEFSDNLNIYPNEFELWPGQIRPVRISGDFSSYSEGVKKTNISILSKAKDKKSFNAISGIKIPLSIYINGNYFTWSGPAVFIVVFLGLLIIFVLAHVLIFLFRGQPKKYKWPIVNLLVHHKKKKWYKW